MIAIAFLQPEGHAQGCVAIRSTGNSCSVGMPGAGNGWQLNFNNRYFKSFRHFVGTDEQKHRVEEGTEVINHSFSWDFTLTRIFNNRWSLALGVPILSNVRSSLYEHGGNSAGPSGRHETHSFGMGDIRLTAYRWMFDPATAHKGNLQAGLGIKLPTGDYQYQDYFIKSDGSRVLGPVDQSIQLGDGGTGFIAELNGFYNISHRAGLYGNIYYLINPREQNGVSTARGGTPGATALQYFTATMSVPDQYMLRAGGTWRGGDITLAAGIRMEAIPAEDLIGGSGGFRRPGYVISAEPAITYHARKISIYASVPYALVRDRTQSHGDKLRSADTGTKFQGDAAFADYSINVGATFRL